MVGITLAGAGATATAFHQISENIGHNRIVKSREIFQ
jgi:hypothetical protein